MAIKLSPYGYSSKSRMTFKLSPYGYSSQARMAILLRLRLKKELNMHPILHMMMMISPAFHGTVGALYQNQPFVLTLSSPAPSLQLLLRTSKEWLGRLLSLDTPPKL